MISPLYMHVYQPTPALCPDDISSYYSFHVGSGCQTTDGHSLAIALASQVFQYAVRIINSIVGIGCIIDTVKRSEHHP